MNHVNVSLHKHTKLTLDKLSRMIRHEMQLKGHTYTDLGRHLDMTKNMTFRLVWPGRRQPDGTLYGYAQKLDDIQRALDYCDASWSDLAPPSHIGWHNVQEMLFQYGCVTGLDTTAISEALTILINHQIKTKEEEEGKENNSAVL